MAKWLVPHLRCLTLPVAVTRNRFLVDLWVFCLVMTRLPSARSQGIEWEGVEV